jgi:hypothetical protein
MSVYNTGYRDVYMPVCNGYKRNKYSCLEIGHTDPGKTTGCGDGFIPFYNTDY